MNTFTRKSLYAALAGVSALGVTGAAQAVNVNPGGLGQVLIYPYYTVRSGTTGLAAGNAYNTLLSVVNSTNSVKAVKVRFLEGKNSREVLDFNLFLSPNDVWVTAVTPNAAGGGHISLSDKSCTLPPIPTGGQDFVNFAYVSTNSDHSSSATSLDSLDRSQEGYIEIIEMATYTSGSTTGKAATHVSGTPPCGSNLNDTQAALDAQPLSGGLFGGALLVNVNAGSSFSEDAVALDNFITFGSNYQPAGNIAPDLSQATPPRSQVAGVNNSVYTSTWSAISPTCFITSCNADPVSAVLMHDRIMNEFVLDSGTKSATDWVVTFPTKRFYVNVGTGNAPKLFQRNFNNLAGSCDDVTLDVFDREEFSAPTSFSPPPPSQTNSLCWEANVIAFNATTTVPTIVSNVLGSTNAANVPTGFQDGWMRVGFFPLPVGTSGQNPFTHQLTNNLNTSITTILGGTTILQNATYNGLPVVGFALQTFNNGAVPVGGVNVFKSFGGSFVQKSTTSIQ